MKKVLVTISVIVALVAILSAREPQKPESRIYPLTTVVVSLDYDHDIVTVGTFNGFTYQFRGCDDWCIGDICSCIMADNGTEDILDDRIEACRYDGWLDGFKPESASQSACPSA